MTPYLLVIGQQKNVSNLARILRCFHVVSGLKLNFNKLKVFGIGADFEEVRRWAGPLGCAPSPSLLSTLEYQQEKT